jgi:hypothetical protein
MLEGRRSLGNTGKSKVRQGCRGKALLALLLGLCTAPLAQARGEFCGGLPPAGFDQPPNHPRIGDYVNAPYGYALTIPPGRTAYARAQGPERGFGIVLSWTPRAFLRVDAAYDVFYDITAAIVHLRDLNAIRLHDVVLTDHIAAAALAHEPGGRYVTRVQCAGDPMVYIHDDVIVMRRREIYRVDLQTVPERYSQDVKLLEGIVRSWRWVPVKPASPAS